VSDGVNHRDELVVLGNGEPNLPVDGVVPGRAASGSPGMQWANRRGFTWP
jgi:hypothetical protein